MPVPSSSDGEAADYPAQPHDKGKLAVFLTPANSSRGDIDIAVGTAGTIVPTGFKSCPTCGSLPKNEDKSSPVRMLKFSTSRFTLYN